MSMPVRHLPVLQNWDCHLCGGCCREYQIHVTEEERQRILAQGWDKDPEIGDLPLFIRTGPWWRRRYRLSERGDGACIFLSPEGRCRIHERFGPEGKPLACRVFPFVLVPTGDHWRVGVRYACPSAAANKGRPVGEQAADLRVYAEGLEKQTRVGEGERRPPALQKGQQVDWPDLLRFVQALLAILRNRNDRVEYRMRKCLALARLCRQARFDQVKGGRLSEFLQLVGSTLGEEAPADRGAVGLPTWIGRMLFRQATALYVRRDHGADRGPALRNRLTLLGAARQFLRGRGPVPQIHRQLPETTFEALEEPRGPLPAAAEEVLERYYLVKVESLQFCGPTNFGLPFWDGLESLALTLPIVLWLSRAFAPSPGPEAVMQALSVVDYHFGFNPLLGTLRQRFGLGILTRYRELEKLIAWYSR